MPVTYERTAAWLGRRQWLGLVAGGLVWAAWLGGILLGDGEADVFGQILSTDHLAFYAPARMIREGREAEIYTPDTIIEYEAGLFAPGKWNSYEALRNPPFFALLYVPTAGLPYAVSCWIWSAIGLGCLVVGVHWLGPARQWRAVAWAAAFLPVFCVIGYGQNTLLSFAVFCGAYRLLANDRPFAAGLAAGLLWFKPPLLLGLFVWWALDVRRYWACWVGLVVTGAVLTAASYPIVPGAWAEFVNHLAENLRFDNFEWWKAHNARAFWRQLLTPEAAVTVGGRDVSVAIVLWVVSAAVGLVLFVRVWWAARRGEIGEAGGSRSDLPLLFAASTLFMLWATPHAMIYEWALAVVPAVLLWERFPHHRPAWTVFFTIEWVALFVSTDVGRAQEWVERWFGLTTTHVVQLSVPIYAWVCWQAGRLFTARGGSAATTGAKSSSETGEWNGSRGPTAEAAATPAGRAS